MNERVMQFRVGVMVLATLLISGILILLFDGLPAIGVPKYVVYIRFTEAPGVTDGTPIRKSGIRIGRVRTLQFAEDIPDLAAANEDGVVVVAEIEPNRTVRTDEIPQIRSSLLGDAYIEFIRGRAPAPDARAYRAGETIVNGRIATDPLQFLNNVEGDLAVTMKSLAGTSDEIGGLARKVNGILHNNDEQITRIVGKAESALDGINKAVAHMDQVVGDPQVQANIRQTAQQLPLALTDLREAVNSLKPSIQKADAILADVQGFTQPLGQKGPVLVESIERAAFKMDSVLGELDQFTKSINSSEGTIGRLINDPMLYESLNSVAMNVNDLTRDLRPILKDARVLSDKISRHPETLGVRGALFPNSGIK